MTGTERSAPLRVRKAAVLGAGVMGAQIAAHLVNADVETILFDLAAKDGIDWIDYKKQLKKAEQWNVEVY